MLTALLTCVRPPKERTEANRTRPGNYLSCVELRTAHIPPPEELRAESVSSPTVSGWLHACLLPRSAARSDGKWNAIAREARSGLQTTFLLPPRWRPSYTLLRARVGYIRLAVVFISNGHESDSRGMADSTNVMPLRLTTHRARRDAARIRTSICRHLLKHSGSPPPRPWGCARADRSSRA